MNSLPCTEARCNKTFSQVFGDGNGNPGLAKRMDRVEVTLQGDMEHDGALTLLRQIHTKLEATEEYREKREEEEKEKPTKRIDRLKSLTYIFNTIIMLIMAMVVFFITKGAL